MKTRRIPQRMCVGCRETRSKREMVRVVRTPAGEVRIDPTGKASGRGAYVDLREGCLTRALRGGLAAALEVEIPGEIGVALRELLERPQVPSQPKLIRIPARRTV